MSVMKIEPKTMMVMKNFSSINPSIIFHEGNEMMTVSPTKSVLARAKIDQTFDRRFAIYDLSRFIGVMSLFNDPVLDFDTNSVKIISDERELDYRYADESTIIAPDPEKIPTFKTDIELVLTQAIFSDIQRALGALGMPEIAVTGNGSKMWIQVIDSKIPNGDSYKISLGETDKKFSLVFNAENLKLIPQDYNIKITSRGLSHFKGTSVVDIEYWIALNAKASKFEA